MNTTLKVAYFGSPEFSAKFLEKILQDDKLPVDISLVVTQPDKSVGRKQDPQPSAVKQIAVKNNIPVFNSPFSTLKSQIEELDLALIYFYGEILPKELLDLPKYGFWNIHFSLLSQYRGTSPATFSLVMGDQETGVSLVLTDEKLDHGPLIAQKKVLIEPHETRIDLETRLHNIAYEMFVENIEKILSDTEGYNPRGYNTEGWKTEGWKSRLNSQDHLRSTYTRFPTRNDGYIPLGILQDAFEEKNTKFVPKIVQDYCEKNKLKIQQRNLQKTLFDLYRGLHPWPGIWTELEIKGVKKRLKILEIDPENFQISNLKFQIKSVQLEGKTPVAFSQFNKAYSVFQIPNIKSR